MLCTNCGGTIQEGVSYCTYCGMPVRRPAEPPSRDAVDKLKEHLDASANERQGTDRIISVFWVIIPFIVLIAVSVVTMVIMIAAVMDTLEEFDPDDPEWEREMSGRYDLVVLATSLLGVPVYVVMAKVTYDLVNRHNRHFDRERRLRDAVKTLLYPGGAYASGFSLPPGAEARRSAVFWGSVVIISQAISVLMSALMDYGGYIEVGKLLLLALLALGALTVFILEIYILHILTSEMVSHNARWHGFVSETKVELARMGFMAGDLREPYRLPDRSSAIYVVLTIFTGGLFMFYWWYAAVKDGNRHLQSHVLFEQDLRRMLDTMTAEKKADVTPTA